MLTMTLVTRHDRIGRILRRVAVITITGNICLYDSIEIAEEKKPAPARSKRTRRSFRDRPERRRPFDGFIENKMNRSRPNLNIYLFRSCCAVQIII